MRGVELPSMTLISPRLTGARLVNGDALIWMDSKIFLHLSYHLLAPLRTLSISPLIPLYSIHLVNTCVIH
jgi:hypothetical protein